MSRSLATSRPPKSENVAEGYSIDPTVGPMLAYQRSLPHLPVPTLASTTAKYLETVQPHLTKDEFRRTKDAVEEFASSDLGKDLQKRLEARATDTKTHPNWIAEWWNDAAYMGYRGTNVFYFRVYLANSCF